MESQADPKANLYPAPVSGSNLPAVDYRQPLPEFEDSADLRDYLEVVLRRKWLVLTFLVGVFVTTLIVSLSMQPVFKAGGALELSPQAFKVTKFEDMIGSQLKNRDFIQTQVKLLESDSLADRVVNRLQLEQHPLFNPHVAQPKAEPGPLQRGLAVLQETVEGWKSDVAGWFGVEAQKGGDGSAALQQLRKQNAMRGWFQGNLTVEPERDTTIVSLSFTSTDPQLARDAVNTLIKQFIGWEMDKRIDAAAEAKKQLEKQQEVARVQLEKSETRLNQFAQKAGIVSLDSKLNMVYRQLEETNNALAVAQAERITKEAHNREARKSDVSSLPLVINNALIQSLREQYVESVAQYEEMAATYKPDHPRMKNLAAKLNNIQAKIRAQERLILDSIQNDYLAALDTERSLSAAAEKKKAQALELNNRATQYKILEREVETNKEIYQSLLQRGKEIDANVGTDLSNIRVVDYAKLPLTPYKPKIRLNLLLAIVVGLMGGVGLAFLLEYFDNTVKRLEEITDRFQIPVLGVIPLAEPGEWQDLDRLVMKKPKSGFAEAIRTAKVSIQLSSFMDQTPRTLLISSIGAGEGKSTISANLAQAFASSEEKVVLVDCDLRKPRLHKTFYNGFRPRGLSHFLSGLCKAEDLLLKTEAPNLYFIGAGPIPPNPAELLVSNRMKQLLESLAKHFHRVILDCPPATGFADVLALGHFVNGVILVSNLGETHREGLRMVRRSFANIGVHLMGGIVNKLDLNKRYGSYYYKYYKYYSHYYQPYGRLQESTMEAEDAGAEIWDFKDSTEEGAEATRQG